MAKIDWDKSICNMYQELCDERCFGIYYVTIEQTVEMLSGIQLFDIERCSDILNKYQYRFMESICVNKRGHLYNTGLFRLGKNCYRVSGVNFKFRNIEKVNKVIFLDGVERWVKC